jgi:capsular exopolysaccharide synthesis family protein
MTPIYEAVTQIQVQPTTPSSETAVLIDSLDPTRALQTQVGLIKSKAVLNPAAKDLGLSSADPIKEAMSVDLLEGTQIVEIKVDHAVPDEASKWANTVAASYLQFRRDQALEASLAASDAINTRIQQVQNQIADLDARIAKDSTSATSPKAERDRLGTQVTTLQGQLFSLPKAEELAHGGGLIVTKADIPQIPIRPNKLQNLMLAAIVGAILALSFVLLAENLDDRIRTPEEVEERLHAPILGYIPYVEEWARNGRSSLATLGRTSSGTAEAYRTLRTNLRFICLERPLQTLLIASSVSQTGKTTTAANLAVVLAQSGAKVVLVSADMRKPSIHKLFGLKNSVGLLDALDPGFPLREAMQTHEVPNLRLLAAGGLPPNPTEILASKRFGELLDQLREISDWVIIDAAPVLGLGDASVLASRVDGVIYVLNASQVNRRELAHATEQLRKAGGHIIGCVLNAVEEQSGYGYYYHHYYAQYEQSSNGDEPAPVKETGEQESLVDASDSGSHTLVGGNNPESGSGVTDGL